MNVDELRSRYAVDIKLADLENDPGPSLKWLRSEKPLAWLPSMQMWLATRMADVETVCTTPEVFTAETQPSFLRDVLGENMLTLEGDRARRLKKGMIPPFTSQGCSGQFVRENLTRVANELIDGFSALGQGDIMTLYAEPLSTISLKEVLGLGTVSTTKMWGLCKGICAGIANFEGDPENDRIFRSATHELEQIVRDKVDAVRATPDGSAISAYVHSDEAFSTEDIINNVRLMISGGINEPRDGIGLSVYACLEHGGDHTQNGFWPAFNNEVLRYYSPVGTAARMTTQPTQLCDVELPAGEFVAACLSSANRDEAYWEQPDQFLPSRSQKVHLAFSRGQHRCLGLWLGLQEINIGASVLFQRLPDLELAGQQPIELHGFEFRGPKSLEVRWNTGRVGAA